VARRPERYLDHRRHRTYLDPLPSTPRYGTLVLFLDIPATAVPRCRHVPLARPCRPYRPCPAHRPHGFRTTPSPPADSTPRSRPLRSLRLVCAHPARTATSCRPGQCARLRTACRSGTSTTSRASRIPAKTATICRFTSRPVCSTHGLLTRHHPLAVLCAVSSISGKNGNHQRATDSGAIQPGHRGQSTHPPLGFRLCTMSTLSVRVRKCPPAAQLATIRESDAPQVASISERSGRGRSGRLAGCPPIVRPRRKRDFRQKRQPCPIHGPLSMRPSPIATWRAPADSCRACPPRLRRNVALPPYALPPPTSVYLRALCVLRVGPSSLSRAPGRARCYTISMAHRRTPFRRQPLIAQCPRRPRQTARTPCPTVHTRDLLP
jgi:hypothetical protein